MIPGLGGLGGLGLGGMNRMGQGNPESTPKPDTS